MAPTVRKPPNVSSRGKQVIERILDYKLFTYNEVPSFLQENPFITSGYRRFFSIKLSLYSLLRIHNETGNIYTHLGACFYFLYFFYTLYTSTWDQYTFALLIFYIGCSFCFLLSSTFHTFNNHSEDTCRTLLRCDFAGKLSPIF